MKDCIVSTIRLVFGFVGFILMMCESADMRTQVTTLAAGFILFAIAVLPSVVKSARDCGCSDRANKKSSVRRYDRSYKPNISYIGGRVNELD